MKIIRIYVYLFGNEILSINRKDIVIGREETKEEEYFVIPLMNFFKTENIFKDIDLVFLYDDGEILKRNGKDFLYLFS